MFLKTLNRAIPIFKQFFFNIKHYVMYTFDSNFEHLFIEKQTTL